jgi:hypothetical protein
MVDIAHEFLATCELKTSIGDFLPEHTVVWEHEGIYRKARMDLLHKTEPLVVDYKTVPNANPADFARRIVQMGYEYQTAQYADAVREIRRLDRDIRFLFLVQEREEPYSCSLVGADPSLLALGHFKMTAACKLWKSCLDRNQWPAYPGQIYWAEAPAWALLEWENRHGI